MVIKHLNRAALLMRLFCLVILLVLLIGNPVQAEKQLVVDMAAVFTPAERETLQQEAINLGAAYTMDIVIVTTADAGGKSARAFADDYYDQHDYGVGDDYSGVLFLIDYDNREAYISTSGEAIRYLTDLRIDAILDNVMESLANDDPYGASSAFLNTAASYLAAGIPSDQYTEGESEPNRLTFGEGAISSLVALATSLIFAKSTTSKYHSKYQQPVFAFRQNSLANLGIVQDQMVNSYVTTRIRPTTPPSRPGGGSGGGRSTVHRSSSGRMHGGGGRKF